MFSQTRLESSPGGKKTYPPWLDDAFLGTSQAINAVASVNQQVSFFVKQTFMASAAVVIVVSFSRMPLSKRCLFFQRTVLSQDWPCQRILFRQNAYGTSLPWVDRRKANKHGPAAIAAPNHDAHWGRNHGPS